MRSTPDVVIAAPGADCVRTRTPLTNSRSDVPSYVTARCVQTFATMAVVPVTPTSSVMRTYPAGRDALLPE
jgi:hypothetical protein